MLQVIRAETDAHFAAARTLFEEYAASLGVDLCFQNFAAELTSLAQQYGAPGGCLLLALAQNQPVGCVALRRLEEQICEMKRLYVKPPFRHLKIGQTLVERILAEARTLGYERMQLDTLPAMTSAQKLYQALGFQEIAPYRFNPVAGTIFMELQLQEGAPVEERNL
jgi:ribosomal protein S18 acetylase RimI-like enzyme